MRCNEENLNGGGTRYVRQFPVKRLFKTWLNFAIAIVLFLIVDICLGIRYDALTIIGSFIGLTSVGNSNWYVFAIPTYVLVDVYMCANSRKSRRKRCGCN